MKPSRLDHGRMYMCVTVGLWVFSLSLLIIGPISASTLTEVHNGTQKAMAFVMLLGTTIKIHGFLSGTKAFMHKRDLRDAYLQAMWAIVATNVGLAVYIGILVAQHKWSIFSVFAGSVGMSMVVGAIWNAWDFRNEVHRLNAMVHDEGAANG